MKSKHFEKKQNLQDKDLVIIHCVRSTVGGIFRHIADLIRYQSAKGHKVGLICDSLTGGAFEEEKLAALKPYLALGVVKLPMSRQASLSDFRVLKQVYQLLNAIDADVVHCHGAKGGVYGRLAAFWVSAKRKRQGRPPIVSIYSPHGGSLHYNPKTPQGRVYFAVESFLARFTSEFIFVAGYEVEAFKKKVGRLTRPWSIAYNGLMDEEFIPVEPFSNAADFVFAGQMRDLKGGDLFIDAIEIAKARHTGDLSAEMIGDGEDRARYEDQVRKRGLKDIITFFDPMPIREVFQRGKILVVPSRAEAMPYIVLEAIGAQVPLLATKVGGIPEIFTNQAHHLLPPGDANVMATAFLDYLQNPENKKQQAIKLHQQVSKRFTVYEMFKTIDAAYHRHLTGAVIPATQQNELVLHDIVR